MSVSISIVPFSDSLDVYGLPDLHAAYSLSGYVQVTLSHSFYSSYLERRRAVSVLLQSLVVTFEGQTELVTEDTGYSAFRLCRISQELVTEEAVELSNEEHDDSTGPCTWNVVFNLTIPGWLPESSTFGQCEGGTRYGLHASAMLHNGDDSGSNSWFSTFCSPFRSHTRTVKAPHVGIHVTRYRSPSGSTTESTSLWPFTNYAVTPELDLTKDTQFPIDLLSKLRVQISVPECVGMEEASMPFALRMRTDGLSEAQCSRLRVTDFDVELEQCERYRTVPLDAYVSQIPVPPRTQQPPHMPLLEPHPVQALYDLGLETAPPIAQNISRTFSLLPEDTSGHYVISGDGYAFCRDTDSGCAESWFSLQSSVGVAHRPPPTKVDDRAWKRHRVLRPSSQSPFLGVSHRMYVTLTCTFDLADGETPERVTERLRCSLPLRFVRRLPETHPTSPQPSTTIQGHAHSLSTNSTTSISSALDLPKPSSPYANTLPAYSQLFDYNGDRKIDFSIPLPAYTPNPSASDIVLVKCPAALGDATETTSVP
ncbi:hypothetical protein BC835DRAFT_491939 [Cytidiella melzeri]|nr:hypothetical protein BC835DRAFT_491939 [Cytidiella melzeri]